MKFRFAFAFFVFDALYIVVFWSLHVIFHAFIAFMCWWVGSCPDLKAIFFSYYSIPDVFATSLILYITVRAVKAFIESIAKSEQ